MDSGDVPVGQSLQHGDGRLEHPGGVFQVGLALFVDEEVHGVVRQLLQEVEQAGDLLELGDAGRQDGVEHLPGLVLRPEHLSVIGHGVGGELLLAHGLDVLGVEPVELVVVEHRGGFADALDGKGLLQLCQGEDLLVVFGRPAQKGDIVGDDLGQVTLGHQALKAGGAVALGELGHRAILVFAHNQGQVDVGGDLPAEGLIQQVVLGGGGEVFAAPHHMGNVHQVVVDDVGKIVGGVAVRLEEHLVLDLLVLDGDGAEHRVLKGGRARQGHLLADDVGRARLQQPLDLLGGQVPAVAVIAADALLIVKGLQPLFGAEAVIVALAPPAPAGWAVWA